MLCKPDVTFVASFSLTHQFQHWLSLSGPVLQVAGCGKDLSKEKDYYQRYRVCEEHLNLSALRLADGKEHRFCQQCGRFHPLGDFDGEKK